MALKVLLFIGDLEKLCCLKNIFKMSCVWRRPWKAVLKTKGHKSDQFKTNLLRIFLLKTQKAFLTYSSSDYRALRKAFHLKLLCLYNTLKYFFVHKRKEN